LPIVGDSLYTPTSSTTKTGRHDIAEILLKEALNTKESINQSIGFLAPKNELSNLLTMIVPDEVYSRNVPCTLN
jgi:hypothetical protein